MIFQWQTWTYQYPSRCQEVHLLHCITSNVKRGRDTPFSLSSSPSTPFSFPFFSISHSFLFHFSPFPLLVSSPLHLHSPSLFSSSSHSCLFHFPPPLPFLLLFLPCAAPFSASPFFCSLCSTSSLPVSITFHLP